MARMTRARSKPRADLRRPNPRQIARAHLPPAALALLPNRARPRAMTTRPPRPRPALPRRPTPRRWSRTRRPPTAADHRAGQALQEIPKFIRDLRSRLGL